jgi:hypothetical protein
MRRRIFCKVVGEVLQDQLRGVSESTTASDELVVSVRIKGEAMTPQEVTQKLEETYTLNKKYNDNSDSSVCITRAFVEVVEKIFTNEKNVGCLQLGNSVIVFVD